MLTVKIWRTFWLRYFLESLMFYIPFFIVALIFSSGFVYLGEDTSSIFLMIFKSQPKLVFISLGKIFLISFLLCIGLQFVTSSFNKTFKIIIGFIFFFSVIVRLGALYPGVTENWLVTQNFEFVRSFFQFISSLKDDARRRILVEWLPFYVVCVSFFFNLIIHMKYLIVQSRKVKKARSSIHINELDIESKIFSIQGMSFILFFIFGSIFLFNLTSSFSINLPKNETKQVRPNVFIFAIDSLRFDRLNDPEFATVMPFLRSKINEAALFKPMLVGIPRTFPSWVEIATGTYSSKTGVRSMFPPRNVKINKKETIFEVAKNSGYSTIFVSDFAGDIFPRYPFGSLETNAPTSNLESLVENGIISAFSPIQATLSLPNLHRLLPALLETPEIADPRLIGNAMAKSLSIFSSTSRPIFLTTFFSTAHFPYAAPGPWYSKFQDKDSSGKFLFRKTPDQSINKETNNLNTINEQQKKQIISLYDGSLNAIDHTLKTIFMQLEEKGWLKHSIVLIFGDHGENLYDGNLGMGHGDGVAGEHSNVTPLMIFLNGYAQTSLSELPIKNIVRTIDIAPTIAKRINVNLNNNYIDGEPLLDLNEKISDFPSNAAYMETGIWFTSGLNSPERFPRINYPNVTALLDIDAGMNFEFFLRPAYSQAVPGVKERAWVNDKYRLITRTYSKGIILSLHLRTDKNAENNLLISSNNSQYYKNIAENMLKELNSYLYSRGVEIIQNGDNSFFYAENIVQ